jgi:hypothetical protein
MSGNFTGPARFDRFAVPSPEYRETEWNHLQGGQDRPRLLRQPSSLRRPNQPTIMEEREIGGVPTVYEMPGDAPSRSNEPYDQRPWL